MTIFDHTDYRSYIQSRFATMPNRGYGQLRKWAEYMGVHTTLISHIMNGSKSLSIDQAVLSSEFFGLTEIEAEYFVILVNSERAGNEPAKKFMRDQREKLKKKFRDLNTRSTQETRLTEEQRAVFYSDWTYIVVWQMTAIPGFDTAEIIAKTLRLPIKRIHRVVEFLLRVGLCKDAKGKLKIGPSSTFVEASSPWAKVHHANWRAKAITSLDQDDDNSFHYTSPLTLSRADAGRLKERMLKFVEEINAVVDPSPSEAFYCLNLDWFSV